jgi:hypothetical protein
MLGLRHSPMTPHDDRRSSPLVASIHRTAANVWFLGNPRPSGPMGIGRPGLGPGQLPLNTSRPKDPSTGLTLLDQG